MPFLGIDNKHAASKRSRRRAQGVRKVKTGCTICKIRRVKCDETRPSCVRCTSTGRKCDGYGFQAAVVPSTKVSHCSDCTSGGGGSVAFGLSFAFEGNYQERRAFELFRTEVAYQLSGDFDGGFWNTLLLQATRREPAIRHAVLALSSLCEQYSMEREILDIASTHVGREGPMALQHYNYAIADLTRAASDYQLAVDVCLVTCMLFAYFEVIRGHHGSAMLHICSGVKILSELQSTTQKSKSISRLRVSPTPYVDLQSFVVIFNRLNSQAAQIAGLPYMQLSGTNASANVTGFCPEIPPAFQSIEEASHSLEYHVTHCGQGLVPAALSPTAEQLAAQQIYIGIFDAWQEALQAFLNSVGDSLSITGKLSARVLLLNKSFLVVSLKVFISDSPMDDMRWDDHLETFKQMTNLAREIVEQSDARVRKEPRSRHKFSIGLNCIAPLYGIASYCRDPVIRREAVALLRRSHNQQGLWNAVITSKVCGKLIEIEEQGLGEVKRCADVPRWARVSGFKVKFDAEGRVGTIAYRTNPGPNLGFRGSGRFFMDRHMSVLSPDSPMCIALFEQLFDSQTVLPPKAKFDARVSLGVVMYYTVQHVERNRK